MNPLLSIEIQSETCNDSFVENSSFASLNSNSELSSRPLHPNSSARNNESSNDDSESDIDSLFKKLEEIFHEQPNSADSPNENLEYSILNKIEQIVHPDEKSRIEINETNINASKDHHRNSSSTIKQPLTRTLNNSGNVIHTRGPPPTNPQIPFVPRIEYESFVSDSEDTFVERALERVTSKYLQSNITPPQSNFSNRHSNSITRPSQTPRTHGHITQNRFDFPKITRVYNSELDSFLDPQILSETLKGHTPDDSIDLDRALKRIQMKRN
ncbi:hypothetical protein HK098_008155 [Nowakowskiella sp. JEL0407]|nr:hypothetical protein HK098_008155 [Nowakowskiella sp. JEL0407]